MNDLAAEFALHYRGPHRPEDALWWLIHPERPGPSSATSPCGTWIDAVDHLERTGRAVLADVLRTARDQVAACEAAATHWALVCALEAVTKLT